MIDDNLWHELALSHPDRSGIVRRRIHSAHTFDIFAGVAQPGARRLVIVAVDSDIDIPQLPQTTSIVSTHHPVDGMRTEIRIALIDDDMAPVFTPFADDVLVSMSTASNAQAAVSTLNDRFEHWRNLLSGSSSGLGTSELIGLFGELWTLRNLFAPTLGVSGSIKIWTGPERNRRDFVIGGLGVEVKTTLTAPPSSVQIRSELQLDATPLDQLLLVALELDESAGASGETVPDLLVELVRSAGSAASELNRKLVQYGYHDVHAAKYEPRRFVLRRLGVYIVDDEFPRITPISLAPGIGEVRYRLNLGACEPWAIDPAIVHDLVGDANRAAR